MGKSQNTSKVKVKFKTLHWKLFGLETHATMSKALTTSVIRPVRFTLEPCHLSTNIFQFALLIKTGVTGVYERRYFLHRLLFCIVLTAIASVNQAIEQGNASELLKCLNHESAKIQNVEEDAVNRYLEQLVAVKKEKGQVCI